MIVIGGEALVDLVDENGATRVVRDGADEQLVRWGAVHLVHVIETMGTVLNDEQRSELAQMLNVHATHELATRSNS